MLSTKNLEKLIELEDKLRAEYQVQLDARSAEIERCTQEKEEQQAVIAKQLEKIASLSTEATANKRVEQLNRELQQRSENLEETLATQKKRLKALQKDLAQEREEIKTLKQFDPVRMKKNLDASKKKLAEEKTVNDALQKSLNKSRTEKAELQRTVKELEARLAELEEVNETADEEAAA